MKFETSKKILAFLLFAGTITIAATSPYFLYNLAKFVLNDKRFKYSTNEKKVRDAFSYLKRNGLIKIKRSGHDIVVIPTEKGKRRAVINKLNDLKIIAPQKWDKQWRVIIFDIPDNLRIKRNAFRRKLKELGFYSLQKSVWVYPFECSKEINFLRNFFGLDKKYIEILLVKHIENDIITKKMRDVYKI
jgi:DNA-binding transcriptional regulator PaaX